MNQQGRNLSKPQTAADSDALPPVVPGGIGLSTDVLWLQSCVFFRMICVLLPMVGLFVTREAKLQLTSRHLFVRLLQPIGQLLRVVDGGKKNCENIVWSDSSRPVTAML